MIDKPDSPLVGSLHGSPNFGDRRNADCGGHAGNAGPPVRAGPNSASMLIMHYTGMKDCARAIDWLSRPESGVSCHYVVDVDGAITQMVAEDRRAWHAGAGSWGKEHDINSVSIGIEIHNGGREFGYAAFPAAQMKAVTALAKDIVARNAIAPRHVLGHSDVSPQRKADPGEKFDWAELADAGVGYWREPVAASPGDLGYGYDDPESSEAKAAVVQAARAAQVSSMRGMLHSFGYGVASLSELPLGGPPRCGPPLCGFDLELHKTVLAFQRHYRPARCDGRIDASSVATLERLLAGLKVI